MRSNITRGKPLKGLSLLTNTGITEANLKEIGADVVVTNEFVEKRAGLYRKTGARQTENSMLNEL